MTMPTLAAPAKSAKITLELPDRIDTYNEWLKTQRIPVFRGFHVDVNTLELEYWDLKGVPASFVILEGTGGVNDAYVCEIPPAGKTKPLRHMYEETVYVTKGHGTTSVWQKDGRKHSFEWGPGSLFAIPLNAFYQHFNSSGVEGARFYAVTNCCFMMNLFHSVDFVFDNDFSFVDRFDPDKPDYFGAEPVAALYEQGRVAHVGAWPELEDQMCEMAAQGFLGAGSPDRVDALVWALSDLVAGPGPEELMAFFRKPSAGSR